MLVFRLCSGLGVLPLGSSLVRTISAGCVSSNFGLSILPLGSLLVRGIYAGCVSSKKCESESDEGTRHGGHGTDITGGNDAFADDVHGGAETGYDGTYNAHDGQASTSEPNILWAYPLEFTLFQAFPIPHHNGEEECARQCRAKVEDYRSKRFHYDEQSPTAHHHCSLGWIRFGWRSTLRKFPKPMTDHLGNFNDIIGTLRLNFHRGLEASQYEPDDFVNRYTNFRTMTAATMKSMFGEAGFGAESITWNPYARTNEASKKLSIGRQKGQIPQCSSSSGTYQCHRTSDIFMRVRKKTTLERDKETFYDILAEMWYTWYDYYYYYNHNDERVNPRAGTSPEYRKDPELLPKLCDCEIGVTVQHFLWQNPEETMARRCKPKKFAKEFATGMWIQNDGPQDYNLDDLVQFHGPERSEKVEGMEKVKIAFGEFDALAAESMGRGFPRPSRLYQPPGTFEEKAFFTLYTNVIHWQHGARVGDKVQTASDAAPGEFPPRGFM